MKFNSRVLVIGLDGASFELILPWIEEGKLPNLKLLMEGGSLGELHTILPPATATAWSTMVTGKNPGKHGIFEFMQLKNGTYEVYVVNSSFRDGKDIWEIISEAGGTVGVVNVPLTYPPRKVNGFLVAGFTVPNENCNYTYPPSLKDELIKQVEGYMVNSPYVYREGNEERFLKAIHETLDRHILATLYLVRKLDWDFFMVVFSETDHIQHAFWSSIDEEHPKFSYKRMEKFGDAVLDIYSKIDATIGRLINLVGSGCHVFVVSDHGSAPLHKLFHTNYFLYKIGLLKFRRRILTWVRLLLFKAGVTPLLLLKFIQSVPHLERLRNAFVTGKHRGFLTRLSLSISDIDWKRTKAFAPPGMGQINVNLKGRYPSGIVKKGEEYEKVRTLVMQELLKVTDPENGSKIIKNVWRKEDLFWGRHASRAPDIQFLPSGNYIAFPDYEFGSNAILSEPTGSSCTHSMEGILVISGPWIKKGRIEKASIMDVAPTILYLMGIPVPTDMDGRVLDEAITEAVAASCSAVRSQVTGIDREGVRMLSKEEEEKIKERLRSLGYL